MHNISRYTEIQTGCIVYTMQLYDAVVVLLLHKYMFEQVKTKNGNDFKVPRHTINAIFIT